MARKMQQKWSEIEDDEPAPVPAASAPKAAAPAKSAWKSLPPAGSRAQADKDDYRNDPVSGCLDTLHGCCARSPSRVLPRQDYNRGGASTGYRKPSDESDGARFGLLCATRSLAVRCC
jgi:hypothetical protein